MDTLKHFFKGFVKVKIIQKTETNEKFKEYSFSDKEDTFQGYNSTKIVVLINKLSINVVVKPPITPFTVHKILYCTPIML